jgi:hypothetical protein
MQITIHALASRPAYACGCDVNGLMTIREPLGKKAALAALGCMHVKDILGHDADIDVEVPCASMRC